MNEREFRSSDNLRSALQDALNVPALKQAMDIILASAVPVDNLAPYPGVHYDTVIAHHYHTLRGIHDAFRRLRRMTQPEQRQETSDSREMEFLWAIPQEYQPGKNPIKTR